MKISIVTISYNQARFLEEAIKSVVSQDFNNIEYIIVDPGSTDGSREIIQQYAPQIQGVVFEPDRGPADGLNKGFALATGDVFGYINADDVLLPGALTKVGAYFRSYREIDVLIGNGVRQDVNGAVNRKLFSAQWDPNRYSFCFAAVVQQSTFFRKSSFNQVGGFNTGNRTCWDGELLIDMFLAGAQFMNIDDLLGGFRLYPETITGSGRLNAQLKIDYMRLFKKITGRDLHWSDKASGFFFRAKRKSTLIWKQIIDRDPHWFIEFRSLFCR